MSARPEQPADSSGYQRPLDASLLDRLPAELWTEILRLCWSHPSTRKANKLLPAVCRLFRDNLNPLRFASLELSEAPHRREAARNFQLLQENKRWDYVRFVYYDGIELEEYNKDAADWGGEVEPLIIRLLDVRGGTYGFPNLNTIRLYYCGLDSHLISLMGTLPGLSAIHLSCVTINELAEPLKPASFRLTELELQLSTSSKDEDLVKVVSAFSSPYLNSLILKHKDSLPSRFFDAIAKAVSPHTIEDLHIEFMDVDEVQFLEFLVSQHGIRRVFFCGSFPFSLLPSSALPHLGACDVFATDVESVIRGRPVVDVTLLMSSVALEPLSLRPFTLTTKPLRSLSISVVWLFENSMQALDRLEVLHITSIYNLKDGVIDAQLAKLPALPSLTCLSLPGESHVAGPDDLYCVTPEGKLELRIHHARLKAVEARFPRLRVFDMSPFSWIKLAADEWRPYSQYRDMWDQPLVVHAELNDGNVL